MLTSYIVNPRIPCTHSGMLSDVGLLCDRYVQIFSVAAVGLSEEQRYIPTLCMGKGRRKLLIVGAIHGREYVTTGFLLRCAEEYAGALCRGGHYDGYDLKKLLEEFSLHIVPMANPDSVEIALGRETPPNADRDFQNSTYKNNSNNVNLNGNFPYKWELVPPHRQGGRYALSERESRFLTELCIRENYECMLSFHCRGGCVYWRDMGNKEIKGDEALAVALHTECGYALCPPTKKAEDYAGGFENWFRHRFSLPALCVELVSNENADFYECCRDFYTLTGFERTRSTLLAVMRVLSDRG